MYFCYILINHLFSKLFQRTEYVKYAKVFPLTALFGVKIPSKWYRRSVGVLEIVCGLAMALIPYRKPKLKGWKKIQLNYVFFFDFLLYR